MWRQSFDVPLSHYEEAPGGFSKRKEELQRRNIRDRISTIARYIDLNDTCDVGGSKGYFVEELTKSGYKGVYGVDPNRTQVSAALARGTPMVAGSTDDIQEIFRERRTKNATLFHVIEHLSDPTKVVRDIHNALPIGGNLVVETPDFDAYVFKKLDYKHKLVYEEHFFYFSLENLQNLLEKIGFDIIYAGRRDFDQYHLSIRESLFRLGLMQREVEASLLQRIILKSLGPILSVPLSLAVKAFGRNSFSLIVARKS